jgi:hypothetical protein
VTTEETTHDETPFWARPWVWRGALGVYVACLVGLIVAYLTVASMQVRVSAYVLGGATWTAGAPNAVRGTLMDPLSGRRWHDATGLELRLLTPAQAEQTPLAGPPVGVLLATPQVEGAALFHAQVRPEVAPGDYVLALRALAGPDAELFEARSPVRVEAPGGPELGPWPAQTSRREESHARDVLGVLDSKGPVRIDVLPTRPELPRGLPGEVWLRTTERATGKPLPCVIDFDEVSGLSEGAGPPSRVETGRLGLGRVRWSPSLAYTWELSTGCLPAPQEAAPEGEVAAEAPPTRSAATIHIATVASQTSLVAGVRASRSLEGGLQSLHDEGGFFIDVFVGDRWAHAKAFGMSPGGSGWGAPAPEVEGVEVVRVQTSLDLFVRGNAWDVSHVVARGPGVSEQDALERGWELLTARHLASARERAGEGATEGDLERVRYWEYLTSDEGRALWATIRPEVKPVAVRAMLAAIPPRYVSPEALINSQRADDEAMAAWREEAREQLIAVIALAMLLGVLALGAIVARGIADAKVRQAMLEEIDLDWDDDGEGADVREIGRRAGLSSAIQGFVVFGTIVLFALSLLMLLRFL